MAGTSSDPPEAAPAVRAASRAAHDIFNVLTVVYGLEDEVELLPDSNPRKAAWRATVKSMIEKLGEIANRLNEAAHPRPDSASAQNKA
jgi:hypothetical protein